MLMKVTIELDPTTAAVQTLHPLAAAGGAILGAGAQPAAESVALDAGACAGLPPEQPLAPAASESGAARTTPAMGPPPPPHPDTFGLAPHAGPGGNGQDAGTAKR
jgi:hypothetical protein